MTRNDARSLIERTMQDHSTWSDVWCVPTATAFVPEAESTAHSGGADVEPRGSIYGKCTCGAILPHYGLSGDRWREHLAAEIADTLADADFFESEDGEW